MHKKDMVDAMLGKIEQAIIRILNNSQSIDSYHYYLITPAGMERLESTCMLLMAVGEGIKGVDKMTNKNLLVHYPEIDWKGVMGMRDIIAHHYFDLDAAVVFEVVKNNLPSMLTIIKKMPCGNQSISHNLSSIANMVMAERMNPKYGNSLTIPLTTAMISAI